MRTSLLFRISIAGMIGVMFMVLIVGRVIRTTADGPVAKTLATSEPRAAYSAADLGLELREYKVSGDHPSKPYQIAPGPQGKMWFTEVSSLGNKIGAISTHGRLTEYTVPTRDSGPAGIVEGPDGNIWFTEARSGKIGRLTTTGQFSEFSLPAPVNPLMQVRDETPLAIVVGKDGALWFNIINTGQLGRITVNGEIALTALGRGSGPQFVTSGPDGALWFTEGAPRNSIGRLARDHSLTEYPVPTRHSVPSTITTGPDDALWFTELMAPKIGRITTSGKVTEFSLPYSYPGSIANGPDGALWFTEGGDRIGRITTEGCVTEIQLHAGVWPAGIATGHDGSIWFTEQNANRIARFLPSGVSRLVSRLRKLRLCAK